MYLITHPCPNTVISYDCRSDVYVDIFDIFKVLWIDFLTEILEQVLARWIPLTKGQQCGSLEISFVMVWRNNWTNSRVSCNSGRHDAHIMLCIYVITTVVPLNFFSSIKYYLSSIISQLNLAHPFSLNVATSKGSWRQGIKGEMTCTVYVAVVWNIIYWIMMIITLFTE